MFCHCCAPSPSISRPLSAWGKHISGSELLKHNSSPVDILQPPSHLHPSVSLRLSLPACIFYPSPCAPSRVLSNTRPPGWLISGQDSLHCAECVLHPSTLPSLPSHRLSVHLHSGQFPSLSVGRVCNVVCSVNHTSPPPLLLIHDNATVFSLFFTPSFCQVGTVLWNF